MHVDAGVGKLGGPLIEDTEVDTSGFLYLVNSQYGSNYTFAIDESDGLIYLGNYGGPFANKPYLYIDTTIPNVKIGSDTPPTNATIDFDGGAGNMFGNAGNNINLFAVNEATMTGGGNSGFVSVLNICKIGDYSASGNSSLLKVDDSLKELSFYIAANPYFLVNAGQQQFVLGDFFGANLSTAAFIEIQTDGPNNFMSVRSADVGTPFYFLVDIANDAYFLGNLTNVGNYRSNGAIVNIGDTENNGNGNIVSVNNNTEIVFFGSNTGVNGKIDSINETFTVTNASTGITMFLVDGGGISSVLPDFSAVGPNWALGNVINAASTFDATRYVEIAIGGTIVKLAVVS